MTPYGLTPPEHAAVRLLLSQRLYSLKIDVTKLSYNKNIIFDSLYNFCRNSKAELSGLEQSGAIDDGCTLKRDKGGEAVYVILYNDKIKSAGRRSFTLAHEVGHVMLGHDGDGARNEAEADRFAAQLLLPSALVWELLRRSDNKISPQELARIFGVSKSAAKKRIDSLTRTASPVFTRDEQSLLKRFSGLLPDLDGPIVDC